MSEISCNIAVCLLEGYDNQFRRRHVTTHVVMGARVIANGSGGGVPPNMRDEYLWFVC